MDSRTPRRRALAVVLIACVFLPACGRKAAPRPPADVRPQTIADLAAKSTPAGIQLTWGRPQHYVDGSAMRDLGGFVIERAEATDPPAPFARIATLEVTDRDRFRQIKRFRHVDSDTIVGTVYLYRVVSFTLDRYFSAPSNLVAMERSPTQEPHAPLPTPQR